MNTLMDNLKTKTKDVFIKQKQTNKIKTLKTTRFLI
jgi:hypothetical protein